MIKKILSNRILQSGLFFLAGVASFWAVDQYQESRNPIRRFMDSSSFFGAPQDPFEEMSRLQKQMLNEFEAHAPRQGFAFSFGEDSGFQQREDDQFIYYEIDLRDQKLDNINVQIRDGQVYISGRMESTHEEEDLNRYLSSSFQRSFPVPPGVDAENFKMEQEDQKIVLKFPKVNYT